MFRKDNGFTARLLLQHKLLYLITDETEITFHISKTVSESIIRLVKENNPKIVAIDMSTIQRIDSSGIGALINILSECMKKDCELILVGVDDKVRRIFKLINMDSSFKQVNTIGEITNEANKSN